MAQLQQHLPCGLGQDTSPPASVSHWRTRTRAPTQQWCCARQEREPEALCERWHTCCHTRHRSPPPRHQHDSHLRSTHRVPRAGTARNAPLTWGYLTFPAVPQRRYHYHTHFADEETEAQRKGRDLPQAQGQALVQPRPPGQGGALGEARQP